VARSAVLIKPRGNAGIDLLRPFQGVLFLRGITEALAATDSPRKTLVLNRAFAEAFALVDLIVQPLEITISPSDLSGNPASVGVFWTQTFTASGGASPYTYGGNNLPAWMSIDSSTGIASGTPTTAEIESFQIYAIDARGLTGWLHFE
jgi:hypothetical protein